MIILFCYENGPKSERLIHLIDIIIMNVNVINLMLENIG